MSSTATLHVAIYHNLGLYKHWNLYIERPNQEETILHVLGYSTNYRFEMRSSNARESARLSELIDMCVVPASKIEAIKEAAQNAPIPNEYPGFNCQDYVLDLLDDLETKGIIDGKDEDYKK